MNASGPPSFDRAIGCAIAAGVVCMTLLIVGLILVSVLT